MYADDIDLLGRNPEVLKQSFVQLEETSRQFELTANERKTKYMVTVKATTNALGGRKLQL